MNYLISISVDNTIEVNYGIILHTLLHKLFLSAVFVFNVNRKTTNDSFKKRTLSPFPFLSKKKPWGRSGKFNFKKSIFFNGIKPEYFK